MRREFGTGSSGRSKADQKRSGEAPHVEQANALSPYHSHEDLSALVDQHDDGTIEQIENLDSKVSATREEARKALMLQFTRNLIDFNTVGRHAAGIALKGTQWLSSSKTSAAEKLSGVQLAWAAVMCLADDTPALYDEVAASLMTWLSHPSSAQQPSSVVSTVVQAISFIIAANGRTSVGDKALDDALLTDVEWSRFERNFESLGSVLTSLAACCPVTHRSRVKAMIDKALLRCGTATGSQDEAAMVPALLGCFEAIGIVNARFPGSYTWADLDEGNKLPVSADKAAISARRALQFVLEPATRDDTDAVDGTSDGGSGVSPTTVTPTSTGADDGSIAARRRRQRSGEPSETIQFREKSVDIEGYYHLYLLRALRSLVGEGLLNHIARNATVRRIFGITKDLTSKLTKSEVDAMKSDLQLHKEEKEEMLKGRGKERQRKHAERHHAGGADNDE